MAKFYMSLDPTIPFKYTGYPSAFHVQVNQCINSIKRGVFSGEGTKQFMDALFKLPANSKSKLFKDVLQEHIDVLLENGFLSYLFKEHNGFYNTGKEPNVPVLLNDVLEICIANIRHSGDAGNLVYKLLVFNHDNKMLFQGLLEDTLKSVLSLSCVNPNFIKSMINSYRSTYKDDKLSKFATEICDRNSQPPPLEKKQIEPQVEVAEPSHHLQDAAQDVAVAVVGDASDL